MDVGARTCPSYRDVFETSTVCLVPFIYVTLIKQHLKALNVISVAF